MIKNVCFLLLTLIISDAEDDFRVVIKFKNLTIGRSYVNFYILLLLTRSRYEFLHITESIERSFRFFLIFSYIGFFCMATEILIFLINRFGSVYM